MKLIVIRFHKISKGFQPQTIQQNSKQLKKKNKKMW